MECKNCGAKLLLNEKTCSTCGVELTSENIINNHIKTKDNISPTNVEKEYKPKTLNYELTSFLYCVMNNINLLLNIYLFALLLFNTRIVFDSFGELTATFVIPTTYTSAYIGCIMVLFITLTLAGYGYPKRFHLSNLFYKYFYSENFKKSLDSNYLYFL